METKLYHYHLTPVTLNPTFLTISALSYNACPSILSFSLYLLACVAVQLLSRIWLLATHGLQHARLCYPSPSPGACSNSCPSSPWCHPAILSSVVPSPCLQSFPASGNFWVSWLFVTGGQSIGSPTQWTWVWVNSRSWWWTGRPGVLQFMRSQRLGHDWVTELNWTEFVFF